MLDHAFDLVVVAGLAFEKFADLAPTEFGLLTELLADEFDQIGMQTLRRELRDVARSLALVSTFRVRRRMLWPLK